MAKTFYAERAEQEANKIGMKFAYSHDVARDMSRAYHVDFSNIRVHHDAAADSRVRAAGKDALAQGNDLFFGKGIFESNDPASKGLVAHEFAHTMQQGAAGGAGAVQESAPMGAEQGGRLTDWFKKKFGRKPAQRRTMQELAAENEWQEQNTDAPVYDDDRTMQDLAEATEFWAQYTPAPIYEENRTMQELAAENEWQEQNTDAPVYDDDRTMQDLAEATEFWAQYTPAPIYEENRTMQELAAENEWQEQNTDAPVYDDDRTMQDLAEATEFWAQYTPAPIYEENRTMQELAAENEWQEQNTDAPVYDDDRTMQDLAEATEFWAQYTPAPIYDETEDTIIQSMPDVPKVKSVVPEIGKNQLSAKKHTPFFDRIYQKLRRRKAKHNL